MDSLCTLYPEQHYHIYNRGNNHQTVFFSDADYRLFLDGMRYYMAPIARIHAYCLLPNHFHLVAQMRAEDELAPVLDRLYGQNRLRAVNRSGFLSNQFSNWFNSFTKHLNNRRRRDGNLFKRPFQRKIILSEPYLLQSVRYTHRNPQLHGLCGDFRQWRYSSYAAFFSNQPTFLQCDEALEWFGGIEAFRRFHEQGMVEEGGGWMIED